MLDLLDQLQLYVLRVRTAMTKSCAFALSVPLYGINFLLWPTHWVGSIPASFHSLKTVKFSPWDLHWECLWLV